MTQKQNVHASPLKQFAVATLLWALPFLLNACSILEGKPISLWDSNEDKKTAVDKQKQNQGKPTPDPKPTDATCAPKLTDGQIEPNNAELLSLKNEIDSIEKDRPTKSQLRLMLRKFAEESKLNMTPDELKALAESIMDRSRIQALKLQAQAGADRDTQGAETTLAEASPAPAPYPYRESLVALVAYQRIIGFALDQKAGPALEAKGARELGIEFLKMHGELDVAAVAMIQGYRLAIDQLVNGSKDKALEFVRSVIKKHGLTGINVLLAWINTYRTSVEAYGYSEKEAIQAANKAICYDPSAPAAPAKAK